MNEGLRGKDPVHRIFLAHLLPVKLPHRRGGHCTTLATTSRWFVGLKIIPTADCMLCDLSMDVLDGIEAIYRGKDTNFVGARRCGKILCWWRSNFGFQLDLSVPRTLMRRLFSYIYRLYHLAAYIGALEVAWWCM